MSTSHDPTQSDVSTADLLERQRGLEARIEKVEREVENLREHVDQLDDAAVTESLLNILIDEMVADDVDVDFQATPGANRFALQTIDDRLGELETVVELLQHQSAEVAE